MGCFFHKWNGCTCTKCGTTRNENHHWETPNGCTKICTICSEKIVTHENYQAKCKKCGSFLFVSKVVFTPQDALLINGAFTHFITVKQSNIFNVPLITKNLVTKSIFDQELDNSDMVGIHLLLIMYLQDLYKIPEEKINDSVKAIIEQASKLLLHIQSFLGLDPHQLIIITSSNDLVKKLNLITTFEKMSHLGSK